MFILLQNFINSFSKQSPEKQIQKSYTALIGDIGGTNIRLALIRFQKDSYRYESIKEANYLTKDYDSLKCGIQVFLKDINEKDYPKFARLGSAGIVQDNKLEITNLPHWPEIDGDEYSKFFNIQSFKFYNDFEIACYGMLKIRDSDLVRINDVDGRNVKLPMSVLGAGTGLGTAFIGPHRIQANGEERIQYTVYPGEGGHGSFLQVNLEQNEYYQFLKTKFPQKGDHVDLEKGLVGPAIPYMYEFCKKKYPSLQQMSQYNIEEDLGKEIFQDFANFPRKEVFQYGREKKDKLCQKVVDFFLDLYGQVIGDVCMRSLPYGGVYLCGNITVSLAEYILENKQKFMEEYVGRREYVRNIFNKIPIFIVKEKNIGMLGAFAISQMDCQNY